MVPVVASALAATAALPAAIRSPTERLPWLPAALLHALHATRVAAASGVDGLADPSLAAVRTLLGALPTAAASASAASSAPPTTEELAAAAVIARSAVETTLSFLQATPPPQQAPLVGALLACAAQLPLDNPDGQAALEKVHAALRALLATGGVAGQRIVIAALQALQAELQRGGGGGGGASPCVLSYLRALLPDVAPLLLRSTPLSAADKPAALKLLLLACAVSPPEALAAVFSLALPLIVGCLSVAADGAVSAEQRELSTLAHTSLTALAKRSAAEFRAAAAAFSADTRTRMETALREVAAATQPQQCAAAAATTPSGAPPKIALKMDFSSFGRK